ncbi:MAG: hypothetical protein JW798_04890 [Prolixibacteraceae bacterium]|nr:hypothetical protein [Prolixibacteraceae bacterium]
MLIIENVIFKKMIMEELKNEDLVNTNGGGIGIGSAAAVGAALLGVGAGVIIGAACVVGVVLLVRALS